MCYIFNDLPRHIKRINEENRTYIYNFEGILADYDGYFCITRGLLHMKYKKLTNKSHSVKIPIKNNKLYLRTYIDINLI